MALRHIAIASKDPDKSAEFYKKVFGFKLVRTTDRPTQYGHVLTDGVINLAILDFKDPKAAGVEFGTAFEGLHHIGFEVESPAEAGKAVVANGARRREDINEALGMKKGVTARGEMKYTGPDGVLFDLSEPGFWKFEVP